MMSRWCSAGISKWSDSDFLATFSFPSSSISCEEIRFLVDENAGRVYAMQKCSGFSRSFLSYSRTIETAGRQNELHGALLLASTTLPLFCTSSSRTAIACTYICLSTYANLCWRQNCIIIFALYLRVRETSRLKTRDDTKSQLRNVCRYTCRGNKLKLVYFNSGSSWVRYTSILFVLLGVRKRNLSVLTVSVSS